MRTWVPAVLLALLLPAAGRADQGDGKKPADWRVQAKKAGLSPADVKLLERHKFLIGHESYRQVFTPYLGGELPLFITADSLLNGFHVLYEESVVGLENAQARRLPGLLRGLWDALRKGGPKAGGAAAARKRARLVVGVALELVGDKAARGDRELAPLIEAEARRVTAAAGTGKPEWLGPPDNSFVALDYTRYKPRGFYTRGEHLERYFRAVSWLQSIPFRVGKDEELLSALALGAALRSDEKLAARWRPACRGYKDFIGTGDDWDLLTMASAAEEIGQDKPGLDLGKVRAALLKKVAGGNGSPAVNDQLAFIPDDPRQAAEVSFRVLSAYRIPDAVLFQRTTDPRHLKRTFPDGLEVCALLGSSFARDRLGGKGAELVKVIDGARGLLTGSSLYCEYLKCLEALLAPAEHDAPAFMTSEAWRAKSCQTALAGWAQLRHTWALHAKQSARYLSAFSTPAGFVEPNPRFYSRLGALARRTDKLLREHGPPEPDLKGLAADLRLGMDALPRLEKGIGGFTAREYSAMEWVSDLLDFLNADALAKLAAQLDRGELPADPKVRKAIDRVSDVAHLRQRLTKLCEELEALSRKQLRGVAFDRNDEQAVRDYGWMLGGIMLYGGNSYLEPKDDAPRVIDVFTNPQKGQVLEVGIGRPRAFYVLYPFKGGEILCRGAVLPYHEFTHATRLNDKEWRALLDSPRRPDLPAWVLPLVSATPVARPAGYDDKE